MAKVIGIDLGTCYSAITIPEARTEEGFHTVAMCPGHAVILDRFKRRITPSVVAVDAQGKILVGHQAKALAGMDPPPIMFSKRWMGEDKTFPLGRHGTLRPVDVAAHILRYLKALAEERLGEEVEEAVITVPAYFALKAKQMTEEAAGMAGLRVTQIVQEPVAAALMYCHGDDRDPLRVMTYDLGGGTFDVAVVEKCDGTISTDSIKCSDGDRFLGGYNFDRELAFHIIKQLNGCGYDLHLDLKNSAADQATFARLMVIAERTKIRLSDSEVAEIQEPASGITDRAGNPVPIEMTVTREEFERLISPMIESTIVLCCRALEQARGVTKTAELPLDEILLVGGSTRIPMIARRLAQEFGTQPRLVEPDLCVALGAGIIAGSAGRTVGAIRLDHIPAETDLPSLPITGELRGDGAAGSNVILRATDGSFQRKVVANAQGGFVFAQVPLADERATEFVLTAQTANGAELARHTFSIRQTAKVVAPTMNASTNVLSRAIMVRTAHGDQVIAAERTPLPFETVVAAETQDTSGVIRIPILDESTPLGEIVMSDVPRTLTVGSAIEVTLTIGRDYQIRARAYVPSIARDAEVAIELPLREQRPLEELQREFNVLQPRAEDALISSSPELRLRGARGARLRDRLGQAETMLASQSPDIAAIQDCFDEIEQITRQLTAGWRPEPPLAVYEERGRDAADLIARVKSKRPETARDGYPEQLSAIQAEAEAAFKAQNSATWAQAFRRLEQLCERLENLLPDDPDGPGEDPRAKRVALLISLKKDLAKLEDWSRDHGSYEQNREEFQRLSSGLEKINPDDNDAMSQIRDWFFNRYGALREKLQGAATDPEREGLIRLLQARN